MSNRSSLPDLLASVTALKKRVAYETEVDSTLVGSQSKALRDEALTFVRAGRNEEAFKLYAEAADLHAESDQGPAAAMCWYDLAETYTQRKTGVRVANLLAAERLYRRALASPAVEQEPHRAAKVRNALASCLRHLAMEPLRSGDKRGLLDEAARLFNDAVTIAWRGGPVEYEARARYLHNWGNLEAQRCKWEAAVRRMDRAEEQARRVEHAESEGSVTELLSSILVHAAQYRFRTRKAVERKWAVKQLQEAIRLGPRERANGARLVLAGGLMDSGVERRSEAVAALRGVLPRLLDSSALRGLAELYVRAELRREALIVLHLAIEEAMGEWRETMAEHTGHIASAKAQEVAHVAARLHADEGEALEAFLTIEQTSGNRFAEVFGGYCMRPSSPLARALRERHHRTSNLAVTLMTWSDHLALLSDGQLREMLETTRERLRNASTVGGTSKRDDGGIGVPVETVLLELHQAAQTSDPPGQLRRRAEQLKAESMRIERRRIELDPGMDPLRRPWSWRLTPELLQGLLREHRDYVLIRLSLTTDLLVVAVWLEEDVLVARSHRVAVPAGLFSRLAHQRSNPANAPVDDLTAAFRLLDLTPALPERQMAHAVVLPSFMAAFLPFAAIGPEGRTLLDRFDAVSSMPGLIPLFDRQSPHPPRAGLLSVAPGGTRHHAIALSIAMPDERRLEADLATVERVLAGARDADVLCFYTHGQHEGPHGPEIALHDGKLDNASIDARWIGLERVELWACQSGVNLPHDLLTPPVDEIFGLDHEFLRMGVRSAIGTLWPVPDLVTAYLVCRYRRGLLEGRNAVRALADAQRWWRDEGALSLVDHVRRLPAREAFAAFAAQLGFTGIVEEADIDAILGPADAGPRPGDALARTLDRLRNPLSWAGFRFVGVAERRPVESWTPEHARALTQEEEAEVERLLARQEEPEARADFDDWQDKQILQATMLTPGSHPTPDQAIRVARLYRDRVFSSHRHNLLHGLAWLHEAMASVAETVNGTKEQEQAQQELCLEAAWLWLDVARGETIEAIELCLVRPEPVAVARARRALEGLPDTIHARAARAWVGLLGSDLSTSGGFTVAIEKAWREIEPVIRGEAQEGYEGIRTIAAACEVVLLAPKLLPEAVETCFERGRSRVEAGGAKGDLTASVFRLRSLVALLGRQTRAAISLRFDGVGALTPRELAREGMTAAVEHETTPAHLAPSSEQTVHRYFDTLEGSLWGYYDDDRSPLFRSTGTLGAAYRRLSARYLGALAMRGASEDTAPHLLATLNLATDLRLTTMSRWVRGFNPSPEGPLAGLWNAVRDREVLLDLLDQAARSPEPTMLACTPPRFEPHRLDPFFFSPDALERGCVSGDDLLAWTLGSSLGDRHAMTAAFAVAQHAAESTARIEAFWRGFVAHEDELRKAAGLRQDLSPRLPELIDPGIRIDAGESLLRNLPEGTVVLGLAIGVQGRLIVSAVWSGERGTQQRAQLTNATIGWRIREILAQLHLSTEADITPARGASAGRSELWRALQALLEPVLDAVLGPALDEGALSVAVLAPGALRPLPLVGLRVGGRPLFERVSSVLHLPSLAAAMPPEAGNCEACLVGRQDVEGDTAFGECAIGTRRHWFEPRVLRPPHAVTTEIVEVFQLEPISRMLRSLSLYGVGSAVATTPALACLDLEGQRRFIENNTRDLFLPRCEVVEIWAATAGSGPIEGILRDDGDRIPGLARSFLLSGAAGVIDLAWPVHDLVKALVCERFGILRGTQGMAGASALAGALAWCAEVLRRWREAAQDSWSLGEALTWLDEVRRAAAKDAGLTPTAVIPFSARRDAPSIAGRSPRALMDDVNEPVQFASFRWWGWLEQ
jgi:CHAT domain-containing protein/tetratricopeptide (TPR) repeat protein